MARNEERDRKQQLGWDEGTPPHIREELIVDPDPSVRAAAAQEATREQLRRLAADPRAEVRKAVAANPNTPAEVLLQMTKDASKDVRFWLTTQSKHPGVLRELRDDPDDFVADTAKTAFAATRLHRRVLSLPGRALEHVVSRALDRQ